MELVNLMLLSSWGVLCLVILVEHGGLLKLLEVAGSFVGWKLPFDFCFAGPAND